MTLTIAGSRSPDRVPMTRPSRGVMPMDVSTEAPCLDGGGRTAISQMKSDDVGLLASEPAQSAITEGDIAMRGAVESVATNAMAAIQMIGNRIEIGLLGKRMVERRVEHRNLRHILAQQIAGGEMPFTLLGLCSGARSMQSSIPLRTRSSIKRGFFEQFSAVHHAMADGMHVGAALDLGNARSIRCEVTASSSPAPRPCHAERRSAYAQARHDNGFGESLLRRCLRSRRGRCDRPCTP